MTEDDKALLAADPVAYANRLLLECLFPASAELAKARLRDEAYPIIVSLKDALTRLQYEAEARAEMAERRVWCAIRNAHRLRTEARPRWSWVAETLAVGSATAAKMCRDAGLDPDEIVGSDQCNTCEGTGVFGIGMTSQPCGDCDGSGVQHLEDARVENDAKTRARRACQRIVEATGAAGPLSVEDAAERIVSLLTTAEAVLEPAREIMPSEEQWGGHRSADECECSYHRLRRAVLAHDKNREGRR